MVRLQDKDVIQSLTSVEFRFGTYSLETCLLRAHANADMYIFDWQSPLNTLFQSFNHIASMS